MFIGGGSTNCGVDHEQDGISQINSDLGLHGDRFGDPFGVGFPAPRVHDRERCRVPERTVGHPVSCDAWHVLHHGFPTSQNSVNQRGLPHIGTAHDGKNREGFPVNKLGFTLEVTGDDISIVLFKFVVIEPLAKG